jgi:FkbM family methyltransferase
MAKRNIDANGLQDKVTVINKGCGKDGWVKVEPNYKNLVYSELRNFGHGKNVETVSLEKIVKTYDIPNESKLKIDCEGCEFPLIMDSTKETLSTFDRILMEYHYGYTKLAQKLDKSSFNVWCFPKGHFYNTEAKKKHMWMGYILGIFVPEYDKQYKQGITLVPQSS